MAVADQHTNYSSSLITLTAHLKHPAGNKNHILGCRLYILEMVLLGSREKQPKKLQQQQLY